MIGRCARMTISNSFQATPLRRMILLFYVKVALVAGQGTAGECRSDHPSSRINLWDYAEGRRIPFPSSFHGRPGLLLPRLL